MARFDRRFVLAAVLGLTAIGAAILLARVLATVFFAITIAYVLYPVRVRLYRRGLGPRLAAGVSTLVAFVVALALAAPVVVVLYFRRGALLGLLNRLPETVSLTVLDYSYAIELSQVLLRARDVVVDLAVGMARASPVIALKAFLFTFVVYALLLRPERARNAVFGLAPAAYHDVVQAVHLRIRNTLYAIYILQATTAFVTFIVAYLVFAGLGYQFPFALAVIAGILQFVPVVGPSILVLGMAAVDVVEGDVSGALALLIAGLILIGFAPDTIVRPYLAQRTTKLPASLYFVGFTGGVLSLGLIGFVAGPLAIAVLAEIVTLVSATAPRQHTLESSTAAGAPTPEAAGFPEEGPDPDAPADGPRAEPSESGVDAGEQSGSAGSSRPGESSQSDERPGTGGASGSTEPSEGSRDRP